ncbi:hypothetical protein GCM10025734_02960 [Kitasatospora paranensis]
MTAAFLMSAGSLAASSGEALIAMPWTDTGADDAGAESEPVLAVLPHALRSGLQRAAVAVITANLVMVERFAGMGAFQSCRR